MKFSLINVMEEKENLVSGYWIQNHIGNLKTAKKLKEETNAVNSNKLNIAIVNELTSTTPMMNYWTNLKRID